MKSEVEETNVKGTGAAFRYIIATMGTIFLFLSTLIFNELKDINKNINDFNLKAALSHQDIEYMKIDIQDIKDKNKDQDDRLDNKGLTFIKPDEVEIKKSWKN